MTMRDENREYTARRAGDDQVDVAPGVPTDRVRWGPILAGTFAALTALAVLSTLGAAIGMTAYDAGDDARRFAIGSGIWGILTMILAFGFGGWLTARSAAIRGHDNGLLNGFMVAGFGIPLLLFLLSTAATIMSSAAAANPDLTSQARSQGNSQMNNASQASATIGDATGGNAQATNNGNSPTPQQREDASRKGSKTAWGTLAGLILAIGAASVGGRMGARDDRALVVHQRGVTDAGRTPTV